MIHYLKHEEVAQSAAEETTQLKNHVADDDEDPFVGINDEDFDLKMEEDETIIDND